MPESLHDKLLREQRDRDSAAAHARRSDPDTSKHAARQGHDDRPTLTASRSAVLSALRAAGPSTDEALVAFYRVEQAREGSLLPRQSDSGIRSRRAELVDARLVVDTGERRPTVSGRPSKVWRAAGTNPYTPSTRQEDHHA